MHYVVRNDRHNRAEPWSLFNGTNRIATYPDCNTARFAGRLLAGWSGTCVVARKGSKK